MAYAPVHPVAGLQAINELFTPDTTGGSGADGRRFPAGMCVDAVDPYFGFGKFMYLKAGAAHNPGRLVIISDETMVNADLPNVTLQGFPFLVARQVMAQNSWGWYQFEGVTPIQTTASVAAGVAVGIGAAGQAGTNSASKQLLGTRVLRASTFTLTKTAMTTNGSAVIQLTNVDGLFYGLTISGTGVSGTITAIDASQNRLTLSANATATGTITATFTYTGFLLVHINTPVAQGAIT